MGLEVGCRTLLALLALSLERSLEGRFQGCGFVYAQPSAARLRMPASKPESWPGISPSSPAKSPASISHPRSMLRLAQMTPRPARKSTPQQWPWVS